MPPATKRRRTSGPTAAAQGTLNFRSSKSSAAAGASPYFKPTKPVSAPATKTEVIEVNSDEPQTLSQQPPTTGINAAPVFQTAKPEEELDEDEESAVNVEKELEKKALALPESKIKAYWAGKEKERKAPRVHQKDLSMREKILREFDMSSRYGPSMGIARLARWKRAYRLEMQPPIEILAVLLKEDKSANDNGDKASGVRIQRSVMDDLIMSSRMKAEIEA